jgi:ABC-type transporter lipoprotein component MlaA
VSTFDRLNRARATDDLAEFAHFHYSGSREAWEQAKAEHKAARDAHQAAVREAYPEPEREVTS